MCTTYFILSKIRDFSKRYPELHTQMEKIVVVPLEIHALVCSNWFGNNFMRANKDEDHLLLSRDSRCHRLSCHNLMQN